MESDLWNIRNAKFNRAVAGLLLENEDTSAFVLMAILMDAFPDDIVFESEPETLFAEVEERFHITLPVENKNKIQAALTAMQTDLFYTNFDVFSAIAMTFSEGDIGDMVDGEEEDLEACEILWAIVEVALLNGTTFAETEFPKSMEVKINAAIEQDAEDTEEVSNDTDTTEEAFKEPYYQKYVTIRLLEVARDLLKLEVPKELVDELLRSHNRSLAELKEYN